MSTDEQGPTEGEFPCCLADTCEDEQGPDTAPLSEETLAYVEKYGCTFSVQIALVSAVRAARTERDTALELAEHRQRMTVTQGRIAADNMERALAAEAERDTALAERDIARSALAQVATAAKTAYHRGRIFGESRGDQHEAAVVTARRDALLEAAEAWMSEVEREAIPVAAWLRARASTQTPADQRAAAEPPATYEYPCLEDGCGCNPSQRPWCVRPPATDGGTDVD